MTTKKCFAYGGFCSLSLLGALFATPAQSGGLTANNQAITTMLTVAPAATPAAMATSSSNPAETTLRNLDTSIDTILPFRPSDFHLEQAFFVDILEKSIMPFEQRIKDAIDKSYVISATGERITLTSESATDILGRLVEQTDLPMNLDQASGALVRNAGDAIGSVGGMLYDDSHNPYPLTSALSHATGGLAAATTSLLQANNSLQPLNGSTTMAGLLGHETSTGLLSPVVNLVAGLDSNTATATPTTQTLLGPVDHLMGGLTGGSSVTSSSNTTVLEPISALLSGLLGGPPR